VSLAFELVASANPSEVASWVGAFPGSPMVGVARAASSVATAGAGNTYMKASTGVSGNHQTSIRDFVRFFPTLQPQP